jgi:hypothetical protein
MRTRSKNPHNKKFLHTSKKYNHRDSTSIKRKIHQTQINKEKSNTEPKRHWQYRQIPK